MEKLEIAYIIEKFPSPTEHFILNEIRELEHQGINLHILVLRKQKKHLNIPEISNLTSSLIYLPKIFEVVPILVFLFFPFALFRKPSSHRESSMTFSLKFLRNYCYSQYFTQKLRHKGIKHIHAHFAFIASDIASILSKSLKVKYSVTAHANDIYTNTQKIKREVERASFLVTCTQYNKEYLNELTDNVFSQKVFSVYHGIDISKWQTNSSDKDFKEPTIRIITVARLVEKKGLIYLLKAIKILRGQGFKIGCSIIGEGPLRRQLITYVKENDLDRVVNFSDFMPQFKLREMLAGSDVFVLPCIVAENGDIDGLPNVILESMSIGVPVISTNISAIPEVITSMETGILVEEKNELAIAGAIELLMANRNMYSKIVRNAEIRISKDFSIKTCTSKLVDIFKYQLKVSGENYLN